MPSSDDELEDAAELEAKMLAEMAAKKSMRAPVPSRGKPPRASFIRIRPSVSGTAVRPPLGSMATPKPTAALKADAGNTTASPAAANAANLMRIALPDGGTLEFDPLTIEDPLALEEEMRAKGLDEAQISGVRNAINQRIQAMMAQFSRWVELDGGRRMTQSNAACLQVEALIGTAPFRRSPTGSHSRHSMMTAVVPALIAPIP